MKSARLALALTMLSLASTSFAANAPANKGSLSNSFAQVNQRFEEDAADACANPSTEMKLFSMQEAGYDGGVFNYQVVQVSCMGFTGMKVSGFYMISDVTKHVTPMAFATSSKEASMLLVEASVDQQARMIKSNQGTFQIVDGSAVRK